MYSRAMDRCAANAWISWSLESPATIGLRKHHGECHCELFPPVSLQLGHSGTRETSQLAPGDSLLMPLNAARCVASDSAACDGAEWHLATLRILIDLQRLSNAPIVSATGVRES